MCHIRKNQKYTVWITVFLCAIILEVVKTEAIHNNDTTTRYKNGCECIHYGCGCCKYIEWDTVSINGTLCTNATYLDHDYGFSVTLTYNNIAIINETVSARNPPPICIGENVFEDFPLAVCLRLYDIIINQTHYHCCFELEARLARLNILPLHLGCIDNNHKVVPSSDVSLTSHKNILQSTIYLFTLSIILSHMMTN